MHIFVTKSKEWNKTYRNPIYDILSMWEENRRFGRAEHRSIDLKPPMFVTDCGFIATIHVSVLSVSRHRELFSK